MTERKLYRCDICGTDYNKKDKAQQCEKHHSLPKEFHNCRYKGMNVYDDNGEYPVTIDIKFVNGMIVRYHR